MNGILNINKPAGWTSHDVVAWVRRVARMKRVGHAGTLDPLATGVLLVCLGQATRVVEYLMAGVKTYRAEIRLGLTTDTYDIEGELLHNEPVPAFSAETLQAALQPFIGDILQAPPAYSAIKQDGVPLHRRARRGEIITPEPRPVTIYGIEMLSWQAPCLTVEVTCAAGTYIRSLAHDLGQSLGCGAALSGLVRTRSGIFMVEESIELDALAEAERAGELSRHLHPLAVALKDLTPAPVRAAEVERLRNGLPIDGTLLNGAPINKAPDAPGAGLTGYAIGEDGQVVAILTYDPAAFQWRPEKVFATE